MGEVKKIRTACRSCHGGCGVIAHVADGKVIKVEGDPESPIGHGSLCSKGLSITQLVYHPDRIIHPMKKTDRGWERITWEEALDTIAEKIQYFSHKYGSGSIMHYQRSASWGATKQLVRRFFNNCDFVLFKLLY